MNTLISTLSEELQEKIATFTDGVAREVKFSTIPNKIMVAIGMRRTGKTYFLLQIIEKLLKEEVALNRILYINFEDNRLYPLTSEKLSALLDSFYHLHPENHDQLCYLFLDEIQNVENWQIVIRRYFDTKKVKIYLTGSSAKLLSKEIATSLRGRSIATEIWPFSFKEFLQANRISLPQTYGKKNLDKLTHWLKTYIKQGGFPETISFQKEILKIDEEDRRRILQDYLSVVIFRDIIERHKITNISLIRYMINFMLKNVGCSFSAHKFYNDLKSQALAVSKTAVHDYLSYIEDAYLAFTVPLYDESLRKVQSNPRKIYAVDTGLVNACAFGFSKNVGHYFENLIYLDLRRARHEIYYYLTKTRREVDFLTRDPQGKWHLFQVCWDMQNGETLERENAALDEAEKELKLKGECITPVSYITSFLPTMQKRHK